MLTTVPSAARVVGALQVADRHLTAREWGSVTAMKDKYVQAMQRMITVLAEQKVAGNPPNRAAIYMKYPIQGAKNAAHPLVEWVLQTRSIPKDKAKAVEMIGRVVNMPRAPADPYKWFEENLPRFNVLLDALTWPERSTDSAGGLEVAAVGPMKVHNTVGADEKKFIELQGLVNSAVKALTSTPFKSVLYGDVYVVGQIQQSNTLAWYYLKTDEVYVRSMAKKGIDDLRTLIHELGHRYYWQKLPVEKQRLVRALYNDLGREAGRASSDVKLPVVGDILPLTVRGMTKVKPVIVKDDGVFFHLEPEGKVKISEVLVALKKKEVSQSVFPSAYSMTSDTEFFAECFADYVLGKLKPDLSKRFEAAVL